MQEEKFSMNPNQLVRFLKKDVREFTREDIISFIKGNGIKMLNFNYVAGDGRLKTLSFTIRDEKQVRKLLDWGERVDGSSLFSYVDSANSDLYVIPRFKTAFLNPFSPIPTLNLLCSYFDGKGNELDIAPEYIVKKAAQKLKEKTGISLHMLGELEYYVIFKVKDEELFPARSQKNYHESKPFVKFDNMNDEILYTLTSIGAKVKYAHSEVGAISLEDGTRYEQYEIELDLEPLEDMADHLVITKWVMRNIAAKYGVEITFTPKISVGQAGTGLHVHLAAIKDGRNLFLTDTGELTETAERIIGGLIKLAPSITAFGNTNPASYLRLVPHQEAPTNVCWGYKNRSVLIRVPLGWKNIPTLSSRINNGVSDVSSPDERQTVELRSSDGSANVYLLLAGIAVAAKYGLTHEESLKLAKDTYVSVNIFKKENKKFQENMEQLPESCFESAEKLREQSSIYQEDGVFSRRILEGIENELKSFEDKNINEEMKKDRQKAEKYIKNFLHCG